MSPLYVLFIGIILCVVAMAADFLAESKARANGFKSIEGEAEASEDSERWMVILGVAERNFSIQEIIELAQTIPGASDFPIVMGDDIFRIMPKGNLFSIEFRCAAANVMDAVRILDGTLAVFKGFSLPSDVPVDKRMAFASQMIREHTKELTALSRSIQGYEPEDIEFAADSARNDDIDESDLN